MGSLTLCLLAGSTALVLSASRCTASLNRLYYVGSSRIGSHLPEIAGPKKPGRSVERRRGNLVAVACVTNLRADQVAAGQLIVNAQVEQGGVPHPAFHLQSYAQRPDVLQLGTRVLHAHALAHNLKRVMRILGVARTKKAMRLVRA